MAYTEMRKHERIEIQMATRLWLDESYRGKQVLFEGFARSRDLAIGGTFIEATYLLPVGFPINLEMRIEEDGELILARGEVVHQITDSETRDTGMGIAFTEVDAENRERLLRFFVSDRIREFYSNRFIVEFPHLEQVLSLKDVALVINLWEDKDGRLTTLGRPSDERGRAALKAAEAAATKRRAQNRGR